MPTIDAPHGAYELVAAEGRGPGVDLRLGLRSRDRGRRAEAARRTGIATRVVSVPCMDLLLEQPADRRQAIIGKAPVKIAVEAAVRLGWDAIIGRMAFSSA